MPDLQWYYELNGQQAGPVSWDQLDSWLKEEKIQKSTLVWATHLSEWTPISIVAGTQKSLAPIQVTSGLPSGTLSKEYCPPIPEVGSQPTRNIISVSVILWVIIDFLVFSYNCWAITHNLIIGKGQIFVAIGIAVNILVIIAFPKLFKKIWPNPSRLLSYAVLAIGLSFGVAVGYQDLNGLNLFSSNDKFGSNSESLVRTGYLNNHKEKSVGDAVDTFFGNPKWWSGIGIDGQTKGKMLVNASGIITYMGKDVNATIQFLVDEEAKTFNLRSFELNGIPQNGIMQIALIDKMYAGPTAAPTQATSPTQILGALIPGNEINLGGVAPLSGNAAGFGNYAKNGYELAVAEWNAKGGVLGKQIKLTVGDDKGDPAEGAAVFTKLIEQDKVSAIVGTVMSKVSLAGAPICQNARIPMIAPTSTNPQVTQVGDFIFRACFIDPYQGTVGAMFAYKDLKVKTAACIFDVGNDYTKGLSEFFKAKFTALGGQVVGYEGHATGTTDFKAQLTKVLAAKPDVLYVSDYYNDVALIAKQARELGFKGPMLGGDGWDSPKLMEVGGSALEGCYFTNHYSQDDVNPMAQSFVASYKTKYGSAPDAIAALGYDGTNIMLNAIQRAGSTDGDKIKTALAATDLKTVTGEVKFDANRNPVKSAVIIEIHDGHQIFWTEVNP